MTNDVIPGSKNKNHAEQIALLKPPYTPLPILGGSVGGVMHHVATGKKLYASHTRCQERMKSTYLVSMGGFDVNGFTIAYINPDGRYRSYGMGACRKF